ncbi:MAG: hypothetical protein V4531_04060 [Actinomycetota bacterium]
MFGVIGLIALQVGVAAAFFVLIIFLSFKSDSCYESKICDYAMANVAVYLIPITVGLTVLLSVVFTVVLTRRGRPAWLSPAVGILVVIVAGIVAVILNLNAFT